MTLTALELESAPTRAYVPAYTAVVIDDATVVLDASFDTASERRDAVVALLLSNHDEVPAARVEETLLPFGGANADVALAQVIALYGDFGVDVHLGEYQRDVGPAVLYTVFTDYGDGTTAIENYGTRQARLEQLRQRAANLADTYPASYFDSADESACKRAIEYALAPTKGRIYVVEAARREEGEVYIGFGEA